MSKQDRQGVRTATDLEQKYNFGKTFAELMGIALDARESVDSLASVLRSEMLEQVTSITRNTEEIILSALQEYALTEDVNTLEETLKSELSIMASNITMSFESTVTRLEEEDGVMKSDIDEMRQYFEFTVNGLTIKAGEQDVKLRLNNGVISFYMGEIDEGDLTKNRFGWWNGEDFHTGNIVVEVNQRAQLGNFAYIPRSNGSMDFLKVGG